MNTIVIGICDDQQTAVHELSNVVEGYCLKKKIKIEILFFLMGKVL